MGHKSGPDDADRERQSKACRVDPGGDPDAEGDRAPKFGTDPEAIGRRVIEQAAAEGCRSRQLCLFRALTPEPRTVEP